MYDKQHIRTSKQPWPSPTTARRGYNLLLYGASTVYINSISPLINSVWSFPPKPSPKWFNLSSFSSTLITIDVQFSLTPSIMQLNWSMQQQSQWRWVFILYLWWWYSAAVRTIGMWEELCPKFVGQDKWNKLRDLLRMPPYTTINNLQWMRTCPKHHSII